MRRILVVLVAVLAVVIAAWLTSRGGGHVNERVDVPVIDPANGSSPAKEPSTSMLDAVRSAERAQLSVASDARATQDANDESISDAQPEPTQLTVIGRAVDEHGQPFDAEHLEINAWIVSTTEERLLELDRSVEYTALEGGAFRIEYWVPPGVPPTFAVTVDYAFEADPLVMNSWVRGRFLVPNADVRVVNVGDVVLRGPTLLASGIVLDPQDHPVESDVTARLAKPRSAEARIYISVPSTRSDASGRFELRGWTTLPRIRLSASHESYDDAILDDVVTGATDVVLHLRPSTRGSLAGHVLVSDTDMIIRVHATLSTDDDRPPQEASLNLYTGRFEFPRLAPGTYHLRITAQKGAQVLESLSNLVVPVGAACADPRLDPIDLRRRVAWLTGHAVREDGSAAAFGTVTYVTGGRIGHTVADDFGVWRLIVPVDRSDFEALEPDDTRIPLRDGVVVHVR